MTTAPTKRFRVVKHDRGPEYYAPLNAMSGVTPGDRLEYYSNSKRIWTRCTVLLREADGRWKLRQDSGAIVRINPANKRLRQVFGERR